MDHLHVMARSSRADVRAAWFAVDVGADLGQHGLHFPVGVAGAARHDAGPVQGAFLAAGDAGPDKTQTACLQRIAAAHGVEKIGVAAIDEDVAGFQVWREVLDRLIDRWSGLDHHEDPARLVQLRHQLLRRVGRCERALRAVLLDEVVDPRCGPVVNRDAEPISCEIAGKVHPHRRQADDSDDAHRDRRLARRRLTPSITTTITGISHQAAIWLTFKMADRISPMTTAAATVQSSPTMKSYKNRATATIHEKGGGIARPPDAGQGPGSAPG